MFLYVSYRNYSHFGTNSFGDDGGGFQDEYEEKEGSTGDKT